MDWHRWIRGAERQLDLLGYTIRCGPNVDVSVGIYLANLTELVRQVEDIHGDDVDTTAREALPEGHPFTPGGVTPEACVYCGLRRIMHETDADPEGEDTPTSPTLQERHEALTSLISHAVDAQDRLRAEREDIRAVLDAEHTQRERERAERGS